MGDIRHHVTTQALVALQVISHGVERLRQFTELAFALIFHSPGKIAFTELPRSVDKGFDRREHAAR